MLNILLSVFVCAAASLFFAWVVSAHVSAPYIIAGITHELQTYISDHSPMLPLKMSRCLANAIHPAVILLCLGLCLGCCISISGRRIFQRSRSEWC